MPDLWLRPDRLFDGEALRDGIGLRLSGGRVAEIGPAPAGAVALPGTVTPGYVDLQVNGGGGVLLNQTPTAEGMAAIAAAHRRFGTVAILPTLITDAPEVLDRAAEAALAARSSTSGARGSSASISKARISASPARARTSRGSSGRWTSAQSPWSVACARPGCR